MSSFVPTPQFAPASPGGTRAPAGQGEIGDILHSDRRLRRLSQALLLSPRSRPTHPTADEEDPEKSSLHCPERRGFIGEWGQPRR